MKRLVPDLHRAVYEQPDRPARMFSPASTVCPGARVARNERNRCNGGAPSRVLHML